MPPSTHQPERLPPFGASLLPQHRARLALATLAAAYLVLAVAYSLATPVGEGPDEVSHLAYGAYLAEHRRLPVISAGEAGLRQAKHPPLYYALAALATAWAPRDSLDLVPNPHFGFNLRHPTGVPALVHTTAEAFPYRGGFLAARAARGLSIALGLVTLAAAYALAATVFPSEPPLWAAVAAATVFVPQFLFMSGVAGNDSAAAAAGALVLCLAVRCARPPRPGRSGVAGALALGTGVGVGLLTKASLVAYLPVAAAALGAPALRRKSAAQAVRTGLAFALAAAGVAGWWFARNVALYGDPFGWSAWTAAAAPLRRTTPLAAEIDTYWRLQFESFWGRFGWMAVPLPRGWYAALVLVCVLAGAGVIVVAARPRRTVGPEPWGLAVVALAVATVYAAVFRLAPVFNLVVAQGRHLFPALSGIAVLLVAGLTGLVPLRFRSRIAGAIVAGALVLAVASLVLVLVPAFRLPASVGSRLPPGATPVGVRFDRIATLAGYRLDLPRTDRGLPLAAAGEALSITLFWEIDQSPVGGFVFFTHLVDAGGGVPARHDWPPFGGRFPLAGWSPGQVYAQRVGLVVDPQAASAVAVLQVGIYPAGRPGARLTAWRSGGSIGTAYSIAPIVIRSAAEPPPPQRRVAAVFEEDLPDLDGIDTAASTGVLTVTLHWRSRGSASSDRTVFVHLVDDGGGVAATGDGPPAGGTYPVQYWGRGEAIADGHRLSTAALAPGRYRLVAGWYDPASGARVPLAPGSPGAPGDEVDLGPVEIPPGRP